MEYIYILNMDLHSSYGTIASTTSHRFIVYIIHYHMISHSIASHQILIFSGKEVWLSLIAMKFMVLTNYFTAQKQLIS